MATPTGIGTIVVGVIVVVLIVGGLIWLAKKGYFEPDTNEQTIEEREALTDSIGQQDFRVPYRRRISSWSLPYKVFVGSLVLLVIGFAVATYQVMKTGSPYQQFITAEIRYGLVGIVGIAGGVYLTKWFDSKIGYLNLTYERPGAEDLIERVPYARTRVRRRDGEVTVPEVADGRLFGLFWRFKQIGEDRRLRGTDKPLDDVVTHKVPPHGNELPDGTGFNVVTSAEGDQILEGATSTADVTYSSPHSMSHAKAAEYRERDRRRQAELNAVKATNAELYQQIRKMRKAIKNEEYEDREALLEDFNEISDMLSTFKVNLKDETRNGDGSDGSGVGKEEASAS